MVTEALTGADPTNRTWTTLGSVVSFYTAGDAFLKLEYTPHGLPVLAKGDVKSFGRIEFGEKRFIPFELARERSYRQTQPGDFILTTRDLTQAADFLGLVAPIPGDIVYLVNQGANIIRLNERVDTRYFVYWCNGPVYRAHVKGHAVGSTQIHLRKQDFLDAPICLPPLREQRAIAHILGTLDDKIELNRKMNATLDEIARTLFTSWFVDFDPVRSKAEGRQPEGMDAATAALFPDRLVDSELGPLPEGWEVKSLAETFSFNPPRALPRGTEAPFLEMKNVATWGHRPLGVERKAYSGGARFQDGDTLLARITPCLENGKTSWVDFLSAEEVGFGSTEYVVMRAEPPLPPVWSYLVARFEPFRQFAIQNMTGTSGRQRVGADDLGKFVFVVPPANIAGRFGSIIQPCFDSIRASDHQSKSLASVRDSLLPELLSGRVQVQVDEEMTGAV